MTYKKICCAIDFSEPSRAAMVEACALSRQLQAELTLLHVHDERSLASGELGIPPQDLFELAVKELETTIASWQKEAGQLLGHPVHMEVLRGGVADEILQFLRQQSIDLLVVATHGRSGLARLVLGSVAEQVVREAECPVVVVRHRRHIP